MQANWDGDQLGVDHGRVHDEPPDQQRVVQHPDGLRLLGSGVVRVVGDQNELGGDVGQDGPGKEGDPVSLHEDDVTITGTPERLV